MNNENIKAIYDGHEMDVPARLMPAEPVNTEFTGGKLKVWQDLRDNSFNVTNERGDFVCETGITGTAHADAMRIVKTWNAHDDLIAELKFANKLILAISNELSYAQNVAIAKALKTAGTFDEMTRYHERIAALAKAGAA